MKKTKCSCCKKVDTFVLIRGVDGSTTRVCVGCDRLNLWPRWAGKFA